MRLPRSCGVVGCVGRAASHCTCRPSLPLADCAPQLPIALGASPTAPRLLAAAPAQAGQHNPKRESYGHSLIVDPWGEIVGRLDDPLATGIAVADIDLGQLAAIRERMPVAAHRRLGRRAVVGSGSGGGGGDAGGDGGGGGDAGGGL